MFKVIYLLILMGSISKNSIAGDTSTSTPSGTATSLSCNGSNCVYAECWNSTTPVGPVAVGDVCACKDLGGLKRYFTGSIATAVTYNACSSGVGSYSQSSAVLNLPADGTCPSTIPEGTYTAECTNGVLITGIPLGYGDSLCSCNSTSLKRYLKDSDEKNDTVYTHQYTCNDGSQVMSSLLIKTVVSTACDGKGGVAEYEIKDGTIILASGDATKSTSTTTTTTTSGSSSGGTDGSTTGTKVDGGTTTGGVVGDTISGDGTTTGDVKTDGGGTTTGATMFDGGGTTGDPLK